MPRIQARKRRADADDDDDSRNESLEPETQRRRMNNASDDEVYDNGADGELGQGEGLEDMTKKMVRLALACEFQRKPIRRADIGQKVLGAHGRQFKKVFEQAQGHLRRVFGMQMVELPVKEKVTLQQKRAAAHKAAASQNKAAPTTSWILVSILPAALKAPDIIQPPAAPTPAEDATYTAMYTLLVTVIALSGGSLPDAKMERYLRKLDLEDRTPLEGVYNKTENLMKRMERDGYLVKIRESTGTGEDDIYWVIGPRGKLEVGNDGVEGLTKAVYGDLDEADEEELDKKIARSLGLGEKTLAEGGNAQPVEKPKRRKKRRPNAEEDIEEEDEEDEDD